MIVSIPIKNATVIVGDVAINSDKHQGVVTAINNTITVMYISKSNIYKYLEKKVHGCLHENTKVLLSSGYEKDIKDINVGDSVITFNIEEEKFTNNLVKNFIVQEITEELDWYELELSNGRKIICTEDHKFLVKENGNYLWVCAKDLEEKHTLIVKKTKLDKKYKRYDIEVENNHNFVANGVVVHNSNLRLGLIVEDGVWTWAAGSHNVRRRRFDKNGVESVYWKHLTDNVKSLLAHLIGIDKHIDEN